MSVVSYNKLWKLLIDKKMIRKDLRLAAGISTAVMAKLGKGENVTTDILLRICDVLNCDITDIMEIDRSEVATK
jgi:DNA-binding Xre family transcriptional regulator